MVSITDYGALSGRESSTAIQAALDSNTSIEIPAGHHFFASGLIVPAGRTVVLNGTLIHSSTAATPLITVGGSSVSLLGRGVLDGNRVSQSHAFPLLRAEKVSRLSIVGPTFTRNYLSTSSTNTQAGAAVRLIAANEAFVSLTLRDWGGEGVHATSCHALAIDGVEAEGGTDSWSGLQAALCTKLLVRNVTVRNSGASGLGIDSVSARVLQCTVSNPRYFNGFNFGHSGQPAHQTVVERCISEMMPGTNRTNVVNSPANGFNVVAGSRDVRLVDCVSTGAQKYGFNISDTATDIVLEGCKAIRSQAADLNAFRAHVDLIDSDMRSISNPDGSSLIHRTSRLTMTLTVGVEVGD